MNMESNNGPDNPGSRMSGIWQHDSLVPAVAGSARTEASSEGIIGGLSADPSPNIATSDDVPFRPSSRRASEGSPPSLSKSDIEDKPLLSPEIQLELVCSDFKDKDPSISGTALGEPSAFASETPKIPQSSTKRRQSSEADCCSLEMIEISDCLDCICSVICYSICSCFE